MKPENRQVNKKKLAFLIFVTALIILLLGMGLRILLEATTQQEKKVVLSTPTPDQGRSLSPSPTAAPSPTPKVGRRAGIVTAQASPTPGTTPIPKSTQPAGSQPLPVGATSSLLGTNLNLHSSSDLILTSAAAQNLLRQIGPGFIRIPTPDSLSEASLTKAAQVVKSMGAKPVVILDGDKINPNALENDKRIIQIMNSVFPGQVVYYEYGNEQDFFGPVSAKDYTDSWNRIIPELKKIAPAGHFIGPVNYQYSRDYLKYFLLNAKPRPNEVSWHEYTCGDDSSWTKETCIQRIDNWSVHFADARSIMASSIGTTLPIMISEWNYTPNPLSSDGKYTDDTFMTTWTNKALKNLAANGIFGAMQYSCSNYPIALIKSDSTLSAQGKVFLAQ
jgi:hypothetical protein